MGRLSTALNLPKQIFLKDWGATEFSTDPNILLSFTFILEPTPLHGSIITYSSVFSSIYPSPQKIYFWGSFWELRDVNDNSAQWFNDSSSPILPLTGWERDNAQGPAGTITPILTNTKNISIKKQNLGGGRLLTRQFLPNDLNGLSLWLRADAGVTYDGSNNVSSWADQSGNGKNAETVNGGVNSPIYVANALNNKPAIRFNNVAQSGNSYMRILNPSFNLKNSTCLIVAKQNSTVSTFFARIISFLPSSGDDYNSNNGFTFNFRNYNSYLEAMSNLQYAYKNNALADGVYAIVGYNINSQGLITVFYDGVAGDGTGINTSMSSQNGGNVYIAQGSQLAGALSALDGEIAEIIIYNRVLATQERQQIETYLNNKYAIY